jgi:hypothetical protein
MCGPLTDRDNLPGLVTFELGEREPVWHFEREFVLRSDGYRQNAEK